MTFKRHATIFLATAAVATALIVAFNRIVDPYGIFAGPRVAGFNLLKPEYDKHICLGKSLALEAIKPRTVILGSSRSNNGLDPDHPGFGRDTPTFNAAIDGGNIYIALRYLQHANSIQPLKRVVLGADFFMFNSGFRNRPDFDETFLKVDRRGFPAKNPFAGVSAALTSASTFSSSIATILHQNDAPNNIQPDGPLLQHDWNMMAAHIVRQGGYRSAFLANEDVFINRTFRPEPARRYGFQGRGGESTLEYFRQIVDICRRDGIDLVVVVLPAHARQFEAIRASGLWPKFEDWKRQLTKILADEKYAPAFALWDFSGYNSMTTEEVPAASDTKTEMRWYYESSHFKKALGDLVLDRALGYNSAKRVVPADFGVLLTSKNIEIHLPRIRADQRKWEAEHPMDVSEIENIAKPLGPIPTDD